jgi:hypothetical protein
VRNKKEEKEESMGGRRGRHREGQKVSEIRNFWYLCIWRERNFPKKTLLRSDYKRNLPDLCT